MWQYIPGSQQKKYIDFSGEQREDEDRSATI
jgi:hypothetical protein